MLVNREVAFMTSISVFSKKYSSAFAIELARQLLQHYNTIYAYVEDYLHVVAF